MERYIVFSYDVEEGQGWDGYIGDYACFDTAVDHLSEHMLEHYAWEGQVVDSKTNEVQRYQVKETYREMTPQERAKYDALWGGIHNASGCLLLGADGSFNPHIVVDKRHIVEVSDE